MSVPEGGAAADDLAGLPAGGGGELPEQGESAATASRDPIGRWNAAPPLMLTILFFFPPLLSSPAPAAPGSHVAAVRHQNNGGHSVCGGVRQAHRRLHGAVSE